jgi:phage gp36-like protein
MFIDKSDILNYIDEDTLDAITGSDDAIITSAISDSEELVSDYLKHRFIIADDLAKTAGDRNRSLVKCVVSLSIFNIFERLPSNVVPEARQESYDRAITWLKDIQKGTLDVNLTRKDPQQGYNIKFNPGTKSKDFRI